MSAHNYTIRKNTFTEESLQRRPFVPLRGTLRKIMAIACGTLLAALLQACKIEVVVPPGGKVVTESKTFTCKGGKTCEIHAVDQFFDETFIARPDPGFAFMRWEHVPRAFCGNRMTPCELATEGFDLFPDLMDLLASDDVFYLKPIFEPIPTIKREHLKAAGDVTNTDTGLDLKGSLTLNDGEGAKRLFKNGNLKLEFNADGDLQEMAGTAMLPTNLVPGLDLDLDVMAEIGYFTGKQINENDEIEITLRDERQYMVFMISNDFSYTQTAAVPGPEGITTEKVKINTPAGGKIVMILDPNDDMLYRYGETPLLGAYGEAESDLGLIPFVPLVDRNYNVYRFDGHLYETISVGVGIKAVDVFNLTGEQVTYQPSLFDVDLSDPFNSDIAYRAGFNGAAEVAISVFGFDVDGLFNFDLAQASASFEVSKASQLMTLAANIEPDVEWIPDWIPIVPATRLSFDFIANGKGDIAFNLSGSYESQLPAADLEGKMRITPEALTMQGEVPGKFPLPVKLSFDNGDTFGTVGITADFSAKIQSEVDSGFDRVEDELAQAIADLENAAAEHEFELSLRGLRSSLPGIADAAIRDLNHVPDAVYSNVYSSVKSGIDAKNECITNPLTGSKSCLISSSERNEAAADAAKAAESEAERRVAPYIAAMKELKRSALYDDRVELLATLEKALRDAYARRSFKEKITVTAEVSIPGPNIKVTKSYTASGTILTSTQADAILEAADNIHLIPETSDQVVSAQKIVDHLPTDQLIERARKSVADGVSVIPAVKGVSYAIENGEYTASVMFSDGSRFDVDYNVLDWQDLSEGIGDLLADFVINTL